MVKIWTALLLVASLGAIASCSSSGRSDGSNPVGSAGIIDVPSGVVVSGGGASFPDALYQAVNVRFNAVAGHEAVTYAKSGSVDGRMQLALGTLDFVGSDSLPSPDETLRDDVLYFPLAAAPIVIAFNLAGIDRLSFSAATLASVFQGEIDRWDDPVIASDNPGVELPAERIHAVHRSDGSGTTLNFTTFLQASAADVWRLGTGDEIAWPPGTQGGEKNSGVAELIATTNGSLGYVDLGDAAKTNLDIASIANASGEYVEPTAEASRAAFEAVRPADDLTFDLIGVDAPAAYPITAPTWLMVSSRQRPEQADLLRAYLRYLLGPGQDLALEVGFVPLPDSLASRSIAQIDRIGS